MARVEREPEAASVPAGSFERTAPPVGFRPFRCEPVLFGLIRQARVSASVLWLAAGAILVGLIAVAAFQGTLTHESGVEVIWSDVRRAFGGAGASDIVDADFPLFRDTVSIAVVLALAVNIRVLYQQWEAIEDFVPGLQRRGVLNVPKTAQDEFDRVLTNTNSLYKRVGTASTAIGLLALVLAFWLVFEQRSGGILGVFAPKDLEGAARQDWLQGAYESWWASTDNPAGFVLYSVLAGAALYFVLLQNLVGLSFSIFWARFGSRVEIGLDLLNADNTYGWAPLLRLMRTVYVSLLVHAVALTMLSVVLQGEVRGAVGVLLALIVLVGPVYLLTPVFVLRKPIREFKESEIKRLIAQSGDEGQTSRAAVRDEIAVIHKATPFPRSRRIGVAMCLYAVPVFIAVLEIFGLFSA